MAIDHFHELAPNATLFVVGYPRIIPPGGADCWGITNVSAGDAPVVDAWQQAMANEQKSGRSASKRLARGKYRIRVAAGPLMAITKGFSIVR